RTPRTDLSGRCPTAVTLWGRRMTAAAPRLFPATTLQGVPRSTGMPREALSPATRRAQPFCPLLPSCATASAPRGRVRWSAVRGGGLRGAIPDHFEPDGAP